MALFPRSRPDPERVTVMSRRLLATALGAASFSVLLAQPPALGGSKRDLTPETFAKLHALVRPHKGEWRHLQVRWLTDVVAARKRAAAEDRPIVICYTGGAGYNEPLGVC